jgi:hypothetical protein
VPGDANVRLINFFDQPFQIIDEPQPRQNAGAGLTLAQQAAKFIK